MEFWTYPQVVDEPFALKVRNFIDENLPVEERGHRFKRPYHPQFHHKFKVWQEENLSDVTAEQYAAFRQEADRAGIDVSGMNATSFVGKVLEALGTEEQKATVLKDFDEGRALCSLGYTEPDSGSDVAAAKTRADRDGDLWVINGQKMFTSNADISTYVFLLTRTNWDVPKHRGLTMFLVPLDSPGVEVRVVETLGYHHTCMTFYTDVRVPDSARVGGVDEGWSVMRYALDVEHGAGPRRSRRSSGPGQRARQAPVLGNSNSQAGAVISRTVEWASQERADGAGRPIDDPVNRQRLARLIVRDEARRLIDRRNDPAARQPGVGNGNKLLWSELYLEASAACLDIVGIEGTLPYTEAEAPVEGWVDFAYRGAPVSTIAGGCSEVQRDVIAERRLGLPKQRGRQSSR